MDITQNDLCHLANVIQLEPRHKETSDEPELRNIAENHWLLFFRHLSVHVKAEEWFQSKETREKTSKCCRWCGIWFCTEVGDMFWKFVGPVDKTEIWRVQFSLVAQSCPTLCDPMNRSTPGLPVHHQHPEFTQTHVHWVSDAIQPSHPLSSPSPLAPNPSQHQSFPMSQLFAWGGQSIWSVEEKKITVTVLDFLSLIAVQWLCKRISCS